MTITREEKACYAIDLRKPRPKIMHVSIVSGMGCDDPVHMVAALDQKDLRRAENMLKRASTTDPSGIRADFILGLLNSIRGMNNPIVAKQHFRSVVARSPENVAALNNLALTVWSELSVHGLICVAWSTSSATIGSGSVQLCGDPEPARRTEPIEENATRILINAFARMDAYRLSLQRELS